MKYTLFILLLIPFEIMAQFPVGSWKRASYISAGEYRPIGYDSLNHQAYYYPNGSGQAQAFTGQPAYWQTVVGGPHDYGGTDTLGGLWFAGSNEAGQEGTGSVGGTSLTAMQHIVNDSSGTALPPIAQVFLTGNQNANFWFTAILSTYATGGRVWVAGQLQDYVRGNGTSGASAQASFVPVTMLNSDTIIKVCGLYCIFALTSQGKVQSWGANNDTYSLQQGSSPVSGSPGYVQGIPTGWFAYDVASNVVGTWVFCDSGNHQFHKILTGGWAFDPAYQGRGSSGAAGLTHLQDVTNNAFLHPMTQNGARWVVSATCNSESYYFICNDGTLWDIGGNAVATIGNGTTMNLVSVNWFYNQGQNSHNQDTVYNVAPGTTNWTEVYCEPSNDWYTYANNSRGQLYAWGNNKGGETWNGVLDPNFTSGQIHAAYPNSWCVLWPTLITWPGTSIVDKITTSPYCILNPGGSPCNTYTNPTADSPTVSGANIIIPQGTTSTNISVTATAASTYFINSTSCYFISGPTIPTIQFPSSTTSLVSGLTLPGVYTFKDSAQDNNLRTSIATFTITVGTSIGPIPTGSKIHVAFDNIPLFDPKYYAANKNKKQYFYRSLQKQESWIR